MTEKLVVFMDDAGLLPDLSGRSDVLIISLDSQAASEVAAGPAVRIKDITEYSRKRFADYDELYDGFKGDLRQRLGPKDGMHQSRFLFEVFWDDVLLNFTPVHYIESLIREVFNKEKPARFEFAISDGQMNALFRRIFQEMS